MMSLSDLPEDLESEILSRVPAKSLSELKTTCKRWYALFRDPRFIEKNKKLGKDVRASMLLSNQDVYSMDKDLHNSSSGDIELTVKLRSLKKDSKELNLCRINHCDGLMLCETRETSRPVVWNPCTGQTRLIKGKACSRSDDRYTLGYSNTSSSSGHSYKILSYNWHSENEQRFADCQIYELSSDSDSWRVLDSFPLDYQLHYSGMSLKGDAYWVAIGKDQTGYFLMKFDFTTETFVRFPFPFQILDSPHTDASLSVVKDEKLSVLYRTTLARSYVFRIWVSNNEEDLSWSSHLVLKVDFDKFHIPRLMVPNFVLDEENKVVICCDLHSVDWGEYKTRIYIVGDGMIKQVYNATVNNYCFEFPCIITYVPSLVHIHECTPKRGKRKKKGRLFVSS